MTADPLPSPADRAYFPELDGLRTLAFLLVFGFHGGLPWVAEVVGLVTLPLFVLASMLGPVAAGWAADIGPGVGRAIGRNGWVGVQLFFILSGFLITTLLLREEARFGRVDLRAFWVRRALRIWPLYYLTVAVTFFLLPALDGRMRSPGHWQMVRQHLPWFMAFLGNWSMIRLGPVGDDAISILWSVCVEEQFYILCPLVVVLVGRRWRLPVVGLLMTASVAYRAWLASGRPVQLVIQYNTFAQLDTMLSGVALALWFDRAPPGPRAERAAGIWGWLVLAGCLWVLARPELAHRTVVRQTWDFVAIWASGLGVVALAVIRPGWLRRWLAAGVMVWLGRISYGLYMDHEVALWATGRSTTGAVLALGLTVALASASYYGFERPFLRLKRAWTRVPSRPI
jgi:peptidoglycan/LPS O-acetylase OafA/YrhL